MSVIIDRAIEMETNNFDFWQEHSLHFVEMALRNDRRGVMERPHGCGKRIGECGDTIEMYLTIEKGCICSVLYETSGCMNTNACANTVAELAVGRKINDAWKITPDDVVTFLETLPAENYHCAELAVGAFYLALSDLQQLQRDPWKKFYLEK